MIAPHYSTSNSDVRDPDSEESLARLREKNPVKANRIHGVKTVIVVLSSRGHAYDSSGLIQKIQLSYPGAQVFLRSTTGQALGTEAPAHVDLLIDFTGPGQKQGWFYSKKLRKQAKTCVGRRAGLFRGDSYDRVFNERGADGLPEELLAKEAWVQKEVLKLAGVNVSSVSETPPDLSKSIALTLPPFQKT